MSLTKRAVFRFRKLWLVLGGILAAWLILEAGLRMVGVAYPLPYTPDEHCGSRLRPGFAAWFVEEGRAYVRINSAGHRDREHARHKPPGTLRIAVLGDSYAEALQVPLADTFWSVLERKLAGCAALAGRQVEVLNFGVSGYGTAQQLQMLRHYVWDYEPDIVLLAFTTGNDVCNNSSRLEPDQVKPFFTLDGERLTLDNSFRRHPDFLKAHSAWVRFKVALINGSRVLQVINEYRSAQKSRANERRHAEQNSEPGLDDHCYLPPRDAAWTEAWNVTERLIVEMRDECERHGARLWVVTLSSGIQVHPDESVRRDYRRRLGASDLFYPDRRIEALGRREGIPVVVLGPRMQQYAQQHSIFLHGFDNTVLGAGHWNRNGHRLAGEWIAEAMCDGLEVELQASR